MLQILPWFLKTILLAENEWGSPWTELRKGLLTWEGIHLVIFSPLSCPVLALAYSGNIFRSTVQLILYGNQYWINGRVINKLIQKDSTLLNCCLGGFCLWNSKERKKNKADFLSNATDAYCMHWELWLVFSVHDLMQHLEVSIICTLPWEKRRNSSNELLWSS